MHGLESLARAYTLPRGREDRHSLAADEVNLRAAGPVGVACGLATLNQLITTTPPVAVAGTPTARRADPRRAQVLVAC